MIVDNKTIAGDYMRVSIWNERPPAKGRRHRRGHSSEAQVRLNQKRAEHRLADLIHTNFGKDDYALRLDYKKLAAELGRMPSEEEVRRHIYNFMRCLARLYQKAGIEFRWLYVTERGKKGNNVHHHVLVSGGIDRNEIERKWRHGYANSQRLQFSETGLRGLVHYIVKEPVTAKRWSSSHNLRKPVEDRGIGRIRVKDAKYINANKDDLRYASEMFPGWTATEIESTAWDAGAFGMFVTVQLYRSDTRLFA